MENENSLALLSDNELLRMVYAGTDYNPLMMELATRLENLLRIVEATDN